MSDEAKIREAFEAWWDGRYNEHFSGVVKSFACRGFEAGRQAALEPVRELVAKWDTAVNRMSKHTTNSVECGQVLMLDACRNELAKLLEE